MASPAVRTAPNPAGAAANKVTSTLHLIDASGDLFTDALVTTTTPSTALIQAWATAYAGATQASLYSVSQTLEWIGDADPDNADTMQRNSVGDGINLSMKNLTTLRTQSPRLIAPIEAVLQGNQDIPLLSSTELSALIVSLLAILTGYNLSSAQFTERRERKNNQRIK